MRCTDSFALQDSLRTWVDLREWHCPYAATLTMKQGIWCEENGRRYWVPLTVTQCSQNLRHFLNVLNKQVFGSASQRFGKRVPVIPILEGGGPKRLHYHLLIDCPRDGLVWKFPMMISNAWQSTMWGYNQELIAPCDAGWLNYITKLHDKPDFGMSIDWMNCSMPE